MYQWQQNNLQWALEVYDSLVVYLRIKEKFENITQICSSAIIPLINQ